MSLCSSEELDRELFAFLDSERFALSEIDRFHEPVHLAAILQVLYDENMLSSFLAQLARLGMYPRDPAEFLAPQAL